MPVAMLEGCPAVDVPLGQLSPCSLPSTFSPLSKQHYRLSILQPANPSGQSLCSHYHSGCSHGFAGFFRQTKSFSNRNQGLSHPLHLLLCLFSSNLWEYFPTPCARQFLLASLSPILLLPPCLTPPVVKSFSAFSLTLLAATTWFPSPWIQWLPSTMIKCRLCLWLPIFLLRLSITSPRILPCLFPLPQESLMRARQYTACQDSF